jgi:hypothetical protein
LQRQGKRRLLSKLNRNHARRTSRSWTTPQPIAVPLRLRNWRT